MHGKKSLREKKSTLYGALRKLEKICGVKGSTVTGLSPDQLQVKAAVSPHVVEFYKKILSIDSDRCNLIPPPPKLSSLEVI